LFIAENIYMRKLLPLLLIISSASCASIKHDTALVTDKTIPFDESVIIEEAVPSKKPDLPLYIMGRGVVNEDKLALFLLKNNPLLDSAYANALARIYVDEALFEGVNHDIAFVQMCLETGYLRYGGDVKPEQFNFAGLGATGGGEPGLSFAEPRVGVRAQIQHLKAYGSEEPLKGELVNPRFRFVRRGASPTYEGLAGTWAADRQYAVKLNSLLERLYDFAFD